MATSGQPWTNINMTACLAIRAYLEGTGISVAGVEVIRNAFTLALLWTLRTLDEHGQSRPWYDIFADNYSAVFELLHQGRNECASVQPSRSRAAPHKTIVPSLDRLRLSSSCRNPKVSHDNYRIWARLTTSSQRCFGTRRTPSRLQGARPGLAASRLPWLSRTRSGMQALLSVN
jgi:hypothetical protein